VTVMLVTPPFPPKISQVAQKQLLLALLWLFAQSVPPLYHMHYPSRDAHPRQDGWRGGFTFPDCLAIVRGLRIGTRTKRFFLLGINSLLRG